MKRFSNALAILAVSAAPAFAQEAEAPGAEEGFSLLEEGAKIILRSLIDEVEPALRDMQDEFGQAMEEMGPLLRELSEMIGDIQNYEAPEKLPNGDIIIRRKPPADPLETGPNGEIEI